LVDTVSNDIVESETISASLEVAVLEVVGGGVVRAEAGADVGDVEGGRVSNELSEEIEIEDVLEAVVVGC
jgi:hypothetical protein